MTVTLFDLDGTLVSLNPAAADLAALRADLVALAARHAVPLDNHGIFKVYIQMCGLLPTGHPGLAEARRTIDGYERHWAESSASALLDADAAALLAELSPGLVTNNGLVCVRALQMRGLLPDCFRVVVTRDDGLPLKPAPDAIAQALRAVARARVVMVGDSAADAEAVTRYAQAAGVAARFVRVRDRQVNDMIRNEVRSLREQAPRENGRDVGDE